MASFTEALRVAEEPTALPLLGSLEHSVAIRNLRTALVVLHGIHASLPARAAAEVHRASRLVAQTVSLLNKQTPAAADAGGKLPALPAALHGSPFGGHLPYDEDTLSALAQRQLVAWQADEATGPEDEAGAPSWHRFASIDMLPSGDAEGVPSGLQHGGVSKPVVPTLVPPPFDDADLFSTLSHEASQLAKKLRTTVRAVGPLPTPSERTDDAGSSVAPPTASGASPSRGVSPISDREASERSRHSDRAGSEDDVADTDAGGGAMVGREAVPEAVAAQAAAEAAPCTDLLALAEFTLKRGTNNCIVDVAASSLPTAPSGVGYPCSTAIAALLSAAVASRNAQPQPSPDESTGAETLNDPTQWPAPADTMSDFKGGFLFLDVGLPPSAARVAVGSTPSVPTAAVTIRGFERPSGPAVEPPLWHGQSGRRLRWVDDAPPGILATLCRYAPPNVVAQWRSSSSSVGASRQPLRWHSVPGMAREGRLVLPHFATLEEPIDSAAFRLKPTARPDHEESGSASAAAYGDVRRIEGALRGDGIDGPWAALDFRPCVAVVAAYSMSSTHPIHVGAAPRHWRFEGSLDGVRWTTLRTHDNDAAIGGKTGTMATWAVAATEPVSLVRVVATGPNACGTTALQVSAIELYGRTIVVPTSLEAIGAPSAALGVATMPPFGKARATLLPPPVSPMLEEPPPPKKGKGKKK